MLLPLFLHPTSLCFLISHLLFKIAASVFFLIKHDPTDKIQTEEKDNFRYILVLDGIVFSLYFRYILVDRIWVL
jgi:hypothetical protein